MITPHGPSVFQKCPRPQPFRRDRSLHRHHRSPHLVHPEPLRRDWLLQRLSVPVCLAGHPDKLFPNRVFGGKTILNVRFKKRLIPNAALYEIPVVVPIQVLQSFGRDDVEASLS